MTTKRSLRPFVFFFITLIVLLALTSACARFAPSPNNSVEGWAVLSEKDFYEDVDQHDLSVDYINIAQMRQALEDSGWNPDHIHDLREFTRETLQTELDWLEGKADENDIVILYVSSHSSYLGGEVSWFNFFADEWEQISSRRRLLVVDACQAASFINTVAADPSPHLSIAAVDRDELGWHGLEEEGLPIIGGVFTHYFTAALHDPDADTDHDGKVSVQEAALMAEEQQRAYMQDVVLVVPEFLDLYHDLHTYPDRDPDYPHVIVDDAGAEPLYLALDG